MRSPAPLVVAVWLIGLVGPVSAVEPSPTAAPPGTGVPNLLDRPVVDAIVLDDGESGNAATMLVVQPPEPDDTVTVELLSDEPDGWRTLGRLSVDLPSAEGRTTPFLVGNGIAAPLALVTPTPSGTRLTAIEATADGLRELATSSVAGWFVGAGSADVDGDGTVDLVVASQPRGATTDGGPCSTRIEIRDPARLVVRSTSSVKATLGAASLAQLDERPGVDLAAIVSGPCGDVGDRLERGDLVGLRLLDGVPLSATRWPAAPFEPSSAPLPVTLDPDQPAALIIPDRGLVIDPAGRWTVAQLWGSSRPLGVGPATDGSAAYVALGLGSSTIERPALIYGRLHRAPGSGIAFDPDPAAQSDADGWIDPQVWPLRGGFEPASWIGDADADGCDELAVQFVTIPCAAGGSAIPQAGPSWIGTRPFGVVEGRQRRLLVAASLAWPTSGKGLPPPDPVAASAAVGGWRTGGSSPFAIGELRAQDLLYFPRFPVPTPTVDPGTGRDVTDAVVAGRAGERILAHVEPIDPATVTAERYPPSLTQFLRESPGGREPVLLRTPVRPAGLSGVDDVAHHVLLEPAGVPFDEMAWRITAVTVNDWGQLAGPIQAGILLDVVGPALVLEPPMVSLPWPLVATLQGTTESGAAVAVVGGETIDADRRGRYAVHVSLAPWPQDVTVRATDAEGNTTIRTISAMGGFDVRQIPWQALVVIAVLLAVAFAAWRDARRIGSTVAAIGATGHGTDRRGQASVSDGVDDPPAPTIEELDPAPRT